MDVLAELKRMNPQQRSSISSLRQAEGYTHLQIICCGDVVRVPLDTFSTDKLAQTVEQLAPLLVCHRCGQRATPGRVGVDSGRRLQQLQNSSSAALLVVDVCGNYRTAIQ